MGDVDGPATNHRVEEVEAPATAEEVEDFHKTIIIIIIERRRRRRRGDLPGSAIRDK